MTDSIRPRVNHFVDDFPVIPSFTSSLDEDKRTVVINEEHSHLGWLTVKLSPFNLQVMTNTKGFNLGMVTTEHLVIYTVSGEGLPYTVEVILPLESEVYTLTINHDPDMEIDFNNAF